MYAWVITHVVKLPYFKEHGTYTIVSSQILIDQGGIQCSLHGSHFSKVLVTNVTYVQGELKANAF